eukprot:PhF_6_TR26383/c0_g1_i1/m.38062
MFLRSTCRKLVFSSSSTRGGGMISRTRTLRSTQPPQPPTATNTSTPTSSAPESEVRTSFHDSSKPSVYNVGAESSVFQKIDEVTSAAKQENMDNALIDLDEETTWKNKMMFKYEFKRAPKHLTWAQLGKEVECLDCVIDLDSHRPEELYTISFFYRHSQSRKRELVFKATNDVSYSEGLTDLLAAMGSCLSRSDVHRTIRFDDGRGEYREVNIRKNAKFTSDVMIAFRPAVKYNMFERLEEGKAAEAAGEAHWGFHPKLMDPEYRDLEDPEGTYHIQLSAHALSCVVNRALERLLVRPLKDFYRPSQVASSTTVKDEEEVGLVHAVKGWLGCEERKYPHYTPLEAMQANWLGDEAPFHLTAIIVRLRELTNLKKKNPETISWLSVRMRDTSIAMRNTRAKMLGAGPSPLFLPNSFNPTVNQLLPKDQRRRLKSTVSIAGALGYNDQTKNLGMASKLDDPLAKLEPGDFKNVSQLPPDLRGAPVIENNDKDDQQKQQLESGQKKVTNNT